MTSNPPPSDNLKQMAEWFIANATLSRSDLLTKFLLDGKKDIDGECGYPNEITSELYWRLFMREGVATRIVEVFPVECWKQDPEVFETDDPGDTPFEAAVKRLFNKRNVWSFCQRADVLAGIENYGVMFLGFDDGLAFDQPVPGLDEFGRSELRAAAFEKRKTQQQTDDVTSEKPPSSREDFDDAVRSDSKKTQGQKTSDDGEQAETEDTFEASRKLLYVRVFPQAVCDIAEYESDTTNPRYGLPKFYNIRFIDVKKESVGTSSLNRLEMDPKKVHWTRVIHIARNRLASEVFGTPEIESVYNRVYDIRKILSGSGEMFWKGAFPGYSFEMNPEVAAETEIDPAKVKEQFDAYSNGLQRYLALLGLSAKSLAPQVATPKDHFETQIKAICLIKGIPWRVLMGTEEGQLAGDKDDSAWKDRLTARREQELTPYIIRPLVDRLIDVGVIPPPKEQDEDGDWQYDVDWPDLKVMSDKDKADVALKKTQALAAYVAGNVEFIIAPQSYLTIILGMTTQEAEAVIEEATEQVDTDDVMTLPTAEEEAAEMEMRAAEIDAVRGKTQALTGKQDAKANKPANKPPNGKSDVQGK